LAVFLTLSPLFKILLAAAILAAAAMVWRLTRTKRKIAGGNGPRRFPRQPDGSSTHPRGGAGGSSGKVKAAVIWGTALVLVGWVALSMVHPSSPQAEETVASAPPVAAPAPPATVPTLASRLEPPPPPGFEPAAEIQTAAIPTVEAQSLGAEAAAPAEGTESAAPAGGTESASPPEAEERPGRNFSAIQTAALSISQPAGTGEAAENWLFAPDEQTFKLPAGALSDGAKTMSPGVSSMEPIGLMANADGARPQVKIVPQVQPRERLSAPPRPPVDAPPPLSEPGNRGPVSYSVMVGSYREAENAEGVRLKMVEAGLPVMIMTVTKDNKVWHRVISGNFERQDDAQAYSRELVQRKIVDDAFVFPRSM
jgi:hypothetical protein